MAHSHVAPWMVIAVWAVQKGLDAYTQSEALVPIRTRYFRH